MRVHRLAWIKAHGPIPQGLCVLHHCDVKHCREIRHLFLGTNADNSADMVSKNRQARGARISTTKLDATKVHEIRALLRTGMSCRGIARHYGVSKGTIQNIQSGRLWKYVR